MMMMVVVVVGPIFFLFRFLYIPVGRLAFMA